MIGLRMCEDQKINGSIKERHRVTESLERRQIRSPIDENLFSRRCCEESTIPLANIKEAHDEMATRKEQVLAKRKDTNKKENPEEDQMIGTHVLSALRIRRFVKRIVGRKSFEDIEIIASR